MAIEWKKNDLPTLAQKVADDASETCQNFIYAGIDVELSDGTQHFSLMPNDQTNIDSMFAAITLGASEYPYHPDGGKCVMYSAADIITLYSEYKSFVTKQTTYCNALRQWASARLTRMLSAPSITDAPFPRTSKRKSGTFSARRRRRLRPSSTSSPPKEDRNGKELCM